MRTFLFTNEWDLLSTIVIDSFIDLHDNKSIHIRARDGAWVNEQWLSNFVDKLKLVGSNTNFAVKTNYDFLVNPVELCRWTVTIMVECN